MRKNYNNNKYKKVEKTNVGVDGIISNAILFNKTGYTNSAHSSPLSGKNAPVIDYKDPFLLAKFTTEVGRIMSSRFTFLSAQQQNDLSVSIKRARILAIMPIPGAN